MTIIEAISMCPVPTQFIGKRFRNFSAVIEEDGKRSIHHFRPLEWKSRVSALALIRESHPAAKVILICKTEPLQAA